jgi:hypothetical protein
MWSRDEKLLLAGLGGVGLLFWGRQLKNTVVDVIGRGARLTTTTVDDAGVVQADPDELAAQASAVMGRPVSLDVLALSRMVRSEGVDAGVLRVRVALNDVNDLNERKGYGWSPFDLITYSTVAAARGKFGTQLHRRYASSKDSYEGDVRLVELEMSNGFDATGGAVKFVDRSSFGVQEGTGSYDALVETWAQEGLQPFNVPGYSDDFVVFRRV